jgi:orotidine-5'-phosphate decarboxylase
MSFTQRLRQIQIKQNSLLCIGLDVDEGKIPVHLKTMIHPALEFNRQIIEATHDLVCAYKPNLAFYEAMGEIGITTLRETLKFIQNQSLRSAMGSAVILGTRQSGTLSLFLMISVSIQ